MGVPDRAECSAAYAGACNFARLGLVNSESLPRSINQCSIVLQRSAFNSAPLK